MYSTINEKKGDGPSTNKIVPSKSTNTNLITVAILQIRSRRLQTNTINLLLRLLASVVNKLKPSFFLELVLVIKMIKERTTA